MLEYQPNIVLAAKEYTVVGKRPVRPDGVAKVTGRATYGIVYVEPVAAALARKAGRPVKVTMARTDVFEATGPTSGTHVRVKLGATRDGRLVAGEAHLIYEAGAFPGSPMPSACQGMMGPYNIPNISLTSFHTPF